jgi:NAD(P)-dependent dehydrogenase (short-subunit alcohol dehydrogenase family)
MFRLDGGTALVTGCNRGIGLAMAVALAEAGADIVGVSAIFLRLAALASRRFAHVAGSSQPTNATFRIAQPPTPSSTRPLEAPSGYCKLILPECSPDRTTYSFR